MNQYLDLCERVLSEGEIIKTRNGNRLTIHGAQLRFNLEKGFPIVTTKKVWFRGVVVELLWFLRGGTSLDFLHNYNVHIWDENANENEELGPIYGKQWRDFNGVDQIQRAINLLENNPASTRIMVNAWNPAEMDEMKLPPCHFAFQLHANETGMLKLQQSQRSVDVALGLPFNISSYALLAHIFAERCNMYAKELIMDLGNIHIYEPHIEGIKKQLERDPLPLPELRLGEVIKGDLTDLSPDIFKLTGYTSHDHIKYELFA